MDKILDYNKISSFWDIEDGFIINKIDPLKDNVFIIIDKDKKYILKEKKDLDRLHKEYKLLSFLKNKEVPVQCPIKNHRGDYVYKENNSYYCLYPYFEGEVITDFFYENSEELVKSYGEAIGYLHRQLKECQSLFEFPKMDIITDLLNSYNTIEEYYKEFNIDKIKHIIDYTLEYLIRNKENLEVQLIHRDIHSQNMIVNNGRVTGFIDFDIAVLGTRVFDFCYFGSSILSGAFNKGENVNKWYKLMKNFFRGYSGVVSFTKEEINSIWYVYLAIEIIFMSYFCEVENIKLGKQTEALLYYVYDNKERFYDVFNE